MQIRPILTFAASTLAAVVCVAHIPLSAQNEEGRTNLSAVGADSSHAGSAGPQEVARAAGSVPDAAMGDEILARARENLLSYRSIQARIAQVTAVGPRKFKAAGMYLQGTNLKLRLDYEVEVSGRHGSLLQVCDGQVLWTRQTIAGTPTITRRDVRQILRAATSGPKDMEQMLVAELGLGGLPALLASLDEHMIFDVPRQESIDGKTLIVIDGTWHPEFLERWRQASLRAKVLPDHMPNAVRVYFEDRNLFPRRILYLKQPPERDDLVPMVTLDFVDVVLNAPVSDDAFYFVPPDGVVQEDVTNQFLQRLRGRARNE